MSLYILHVWNHTYHRTKCLSRIYDFRFYESFLIGNRFCKKTKNLKTWIRFYETKYVENEKTNKSWIGLQSYEKLLQFKCWTFLFRRSVYRATCTGFLLGEIGWLFTLKDEKLIVCFWKPCSDGNGDKIEVTSTSLLWNIPPPLIFPWENNSLDLKSTYGFVSFALVYLFSSKDVHFITIWSQSETNYSTEILVLKKI